MPDPHEQVAWTAACDFRLDGGRAAAAAPRIAHQLIDQLCHAPSGDLNRLLSGLIQMAQPFDRLQPIFGSQLADDHGGGRLAGIHFGGARRAAQVAAVDGNGWIEAGEGAVALAARQEQWQADRHRVGGAKLLQHLERGQARHRAFGQLLT